MKMKLLLLGERELQFGQVFSAVTIIHAGQSQWGAIGARQQTHLASFVNLLCCSDGIVLSFSPFIFIVVYKMAAPPDNKKAPLQFGGQTFSIDAPREGKVNQTNQKVSADALINRLVAGEQRHHHLFSVSGALQIGRRGEPNTFRRAVFIDYFVAQ